MAGGFTVRNALPGLEARMVLPVPPGTDAG
jgi:hypothetical protein